MGIIYQSRYAIDFKNDNYIKAIATYNKNVAITKINEHSVENKNYSCKDLPAIIADRYVTKHAKSITIECSTMNSEATMGIFPKLTLLGESIKGVTLSSEDASLISTEKEKLKSYLEEWAELENSGEEIFLESTDLASLDASHALLLLKSLNNSLDLSGAIHLASLQKIVFQYQGMNFVLAYGKATSISIANFTLDIDDGFFTRSGDEDVKPVLAKLQEFFLQWRQKNYEGPVIPDNLAGFELNQNANQPQRADSSFVGSFFNNHQGYLSNNDTDEDIDDDVRVYENKSSCP